jgi:hypothetical protein
VVTLPGDPNETLYEFNVNSQSLFGEGIEATRQYPLRAYNKFLRGHGADLAELVHKITIDMESSTSKVYFSPSRNLTEQEAALVVDLVGSTDVQDVLNRDMDFSHEKDASDDGGFSTPAPAPVARQVAAPAPVVQAPVQEAPRQRGRPRASAAAPVAAAPVVQAPPAPKAAPAPVQQSIMVDDEDDAELADIIGGYED